MDEAKHETKCPDGKQKRIVLVGGGHAHVQVIKGLHHRLKPEDVDVILIDCNVTAFYSGMMPACVAGIYEGAETNIELVPLAKWARIQFIHARAVAINADRKVVRLEEGDEVPYDVVSVDIGSRTLGTDAPGVQEYAITTRPINLLLEKLVNAQAKIIERRSSEPGAAPVKVAVVGGGAAGIELAMCLHARWGKLFPLQITILTRGAVVLDDTPPSVRTETLKQLEARGIKHVVSATATHISESYVHLADGREFEYDEVIWSTGAEGHAFGNEGEHPLRATPKGFIVVNTCLQSVTHPDVFGGGDCVHMAERPMPKAGVYAVRAGPVLLHNLVAQAHGTPLQVYEPQPDFLKLLCTGDGNAIGAKFGLAFYGTWVWKLKDWIDSSFMRLFRPELLPSDSDMERKQAEVRRQYDEDYARDVPTTESASKAAELLMDHSYWNSATMGPVPRSDGTVGFASQHAVLKRMAEDPTYCRDVVAAVVEVMDARASPAAAEAPDVAEASTSTHAAGRPE